MGYENISKGGRAILVLVDNRPEWRGLVDRMVYLSDQPEKFVAWAKLAAVPVVHVNADADIVGPIPPGPFLDFLKGPVGGVDSGTNPRVAHKIAGFDPVCRSNHVWQVICDFGMKQEKA